MDSLHHNQVLKPIKFNSHKGQKRKKVWHSTRPPDVNKSKHQKKTNLFQTKNKRSRDNSHQIPFLNDCSSRMRTEFTQYWMYAKENPGPRSIWTDEKKEIEFALSTSYGNLDNFPTSVYNHYEDIFKIKMTTIWIKKTFYCDLDEQFPWKARMNFSKFVYHCDKLLWSKLSVSW